MAGEDDDVTVQLSVSMADPLVGLNSSEALKRLIDFGPNELEERASASTVLRTFVY
jgi:hypothetical protein